MEANVMALRIPQVAKGKRAKTRLVNFRLPEEIITLLDEISDATGHNRTAVLIYLVRWGAQEWRAQMARDAAKDAGTRKAVE